jgi:hypothetical protein
MQAYKPAPIALFAYKRRSHLQATVDSLARNPEAARSRLIVFSDGPKTAADAASVEDVRAYIAEITGFLDVTVIARTSNLGLAASIIDGVTHVLRDHDRLIVLEDDMLVSPHFLSYMNDGLACYEANESVASIHGYMYPTSIALPETFFLRGADCWGWATWRGAWRHFNPDGKYLATQLEKRGLMRDFEHKGAAPFRDMLERQIAGLNDSWAIRWHAACYLDGLYTLYPGASLVHNIGNDGSGTHGAAGKSGARFGAQVATRRIVVTPIPVEEFPAGLAAVRTFFQRNRVGLRSRLAALARKLFAA